MCSDMVAEYHDLINGADWLTDVGKSFLTEKLDHMEFFIGGGEPHETDPADAELIGSTLLQTAYNYDRDSKQKEFVRKTPFITFQWALHSALKRQPTLIKS